MSLVEDGTVRGNPIHVAAVCLSRRAFLVRAGIDEPEIAMGNRHLEYRYLPSRRQKERMDKASLDSLRAGMHARDLGHQVDDRRRRADELAEFLDTMRGDRASLLDRISTCPAARRDQWYQWLKRVDLTSPGAEGELGNLLEEVKSAKSIWTKWPSIGTAGRSPAVDPVLLRLEQEDRDWEFARLLNESNLALMESQLDKLMSSVRLYQSRRRTA